MLVASTQQVPPPIQKAAFANAGLPRWGARVCSREAWEKTGEDMRDMYVRRKMCSSIRGLAPGCIAKATKAPRKGG